MFLCNFCSIYNLSATRKANLEQSRRFFQFLADSEEEEAWLIEKMRLVKSPDTGRDLNSVIRLMKKHEVIVFCSTIMVISVHVVQSVSVSWKTRHKKSIIQLV